MGLAKFEWRAPTSLRLPCRDAHSTRSRSPKKHRQGQRKADYVAKREFCQPQIHATLRVAIGSIAVMVQFERRRPAPLMGFR
jgi:hypothetical protein